MNERIKELYQQAHSVRYHNSDPSRAGNPPTVYWQGEVSAQRFAQLIVQDYAKKTIQGLMSDPAFVQAMDEYYEQKWAHRFD